MLEKLTHHKVMNLASYAFPLYHCVIIVFNSRDRDKTYGIQKNFAKINNHTISEIFNL